MSYASVEEFELLSFFEVEPEKSDRDVPWPYADFRYQVERGSCVVCFSIHPACRDVSLSISRDGIEFYRLKAQSLDDIRYHKDSDTETLELCLSERESIWLRLRPSVFLAQELLDAG